jgi:hypothetical protein
MQASRIGRFAMAVVLAATAACFTAQAAGEKNEQLIKNSGFEMETWKQPGLGAIVPKHWSRNWSKKGKLEVLRDEELAHGGKACVRITGTGLHQGRFKVEPGMRYRVRLWMKAEGVAQQRILFIQYTSEMVGGKKRTKSAGSWGWTGSAKKVANEWTMVESVYAAPTDGSVETTTLALHHIVEKGAEEIKGAVLVDDVTLRAWDGRLLAIRVASCSVFQDREKYAQAMAKHPELKKKRGPALASIYKKAEALQAAAKEADAPLEKREALEAEFEALLAEYAKVRAQVELDLEDL